VEEEGKDALEMVEEAHAQETAPTEAEDGGIVPFRC
jgi:hypothetical protein